MCCQNWVCPELESSRLFSEAFIRLGRIGFDSVIRCGPSERFREAVVCSARMCAFHCRATSDRGNAWIRCFFITAWTA